MIHKLVVSTLEHQINQALHGEQSRLEALNQMSGKKIAIALKGFKFKFTFLPDNQKVRVLDDYKGEVDVLISSPPFSLLRLLLETTASHNPDVIITGDKTIGLQFLQILKKLEIDWEEQLASWLGNMPIAQYLKRDRFHNLQDKLNTYLQEKTHHLPTRMEMDTFFMAVKILDDDVQHLEQRVRRLQ